MRVLGLDASTGGAGAALADAQGLVASAWVGRGARPAATLLSLAERVLTASGLGVPDLEGIAVATGPGSYAGVRAAVVTAKTLAHVSRLPLAVMGSLEALARAAGPWPGSVWAVIDARRRRLYAAEFRWGPGGPVAVGGEALLEREAFWHAVTASSTGPRLLVGTGLAAEDEEATGGAARGVSLGSAAAPAGLAAAVALRGRDLLLRGCSTEPLALLPHYGSAPALEGPPARFIPG